MAYQSSEQGKHQPFYQYHIQWPAHIFFHDMHVPGTSTSAAGVKAFNFPSIWPLSL